ncbi:MAG: helix-turn-helix domain-containing protein [Acidimicrobiia bacterium]|nr:helix-turn-helix domain-containing protein [Acidimicrobiia bacterium]
MRDPTQTHELVDEADLDALANPIRLKLLGMLRSEGPSTATKLAGRIGESSGSTSYHLRVLEKRGFIEEDPDRGNRRDRWWKASSQFTHYRPSAFADKPKARDKLNAMRRLALRWQTVLLERYLDNEARWGEQWADASGTSDALLRLTPARAEELQHRLWSLVEEYVVAPSTSEEAADVVVFVSVVPVDEVMP